MPKVLSIWTADGADKGDPDGSVGNIDVFSQGVPKLVGDAKRKMSNKIEFIGDAEEWH